MQILSQWLELGMHQIPNVAVWWIFGSYKIIKIYIWPSIGVLFIITINNLKLFSHKYFLYVTIKYCNKPKLTSMPCLVFEPLSILTRLLLCRKGNQAVYSQVDTVGKYALCKVNSICFNKYYFGSFIIFVKI